MNKVIPEGMEIPIMSDQERERRRQELRERRRQDKALALSSAVFFAGVCGGGLGGGLVLWQVTQEAPNQAIFAIGFLLAAVSLAMILRGTRQDG